MNTVSILISTKNRFRDLKECVGSVLVQSVMPDEIILVDASDTGDSKKMVEELLSGNAIKFTYHRQDVISGKIRKTAAWNKAVRLALGDIIIFLDDDVVLDKHYIYHILKTYDENPESIVGVMGHFKNLKEDNAIQEMPSFLYLLNKSIYKLFLLPHETGRGVIQPSGFPAYPASKNTIVPVEIMPTGNMSIKKEVFQEFTFDEWFHGYSYQEDDDFTYRVSRKYKFLYTPFAELIHKASPIARDNKEIIETMKVLNHYYFFKKNMPKSLKNWLAFTWSEFGLLFLRCFSFSSLKNIYISLIGVTAFKNFSAIKGRIRGYNKILQSLLLKKSIEY
ncbi:MAG: glycosyltransferase family 2 protein [Planctomycetota bacterium]|nr:glycosyltransferase family 2 protein [Planctomycetota bacterium]